LIKDKYGVENSFSLYDNKKSGQALSLTAGSLGGTARVRK